MTCRCQPEPRTESREEFFERLEAIARGELTVYCDECRGLQELDASVFTWEAWRGGAFPELFGIPHRHLDIVRNATRIAQSALGWARAENLLCRPKPIGYAILFDVDGRLAWCHVTPVEWEEICRASR